MQLYHHPLSMNSQKVRLALEEKNVDYTAHRVNPLKARNLDPDFFRENPSGALPVLKNGGTLLCESLPILQYIDRVSEPVGENKVDRERVEEWVKKIDEWDAKPFTLTHVPDRVIRFFSRFKRRVVIARMAKNPDLANKYHSKLNSMHAMEEKLKDTEAIEANKEQLQHLLDDAEAQLNTTEYMAGYEFTIADAAFIPVLARIELFKLSSEYLEPRPRLLDYWVRMKTRPSYKKVIGGYDSQLKQMKLVVPSMFNVGARNVLRKF